MQLRDLATPLAIALVLAASGLAWRRMPRWETASLADPEHLRFLLAAALLVGCYFLTANLSYRSVFAVWLAPFLYRAWIDATWPAVFRVFGRIASVLLMLFLRIDGIACLSLNLTPGITQPQVDRWTDAILIAEQPVTAALMLVLLAFIIASVRDNLGMLFRSAPTDDETPYARPSAAT